MSYAAGTNNGTLVLSDIETEITTWSTTKVFSFDLLEDIQILMIVYFFEVLSLCIHALVHSKKSIRKTGFEMIFTQVHDCVI